jgi:hypothetical protein
MQIYASLIPGSVSFNLNSRMSARVLGRYKFKCVNSLSSQYLVPSIKSDKETLLHLADMRVGRRADFFQLAKCEQKQKRPRKDSPEGSKSRSAKERNQLFASMRIFLFRAVEEF